LAEKSHNRPSSHTPTDPHGAREQDYANPVQSQSGLLGHCEFLPCALTGLYTHPMSSLSAARAADVFDAPKIDYQLCGAMLPIRGPKLSS